MGQARLALGQGVLRVGVGLGQGVLGVGVGLE